jgi:hypothetical protein
MVMVEWNQKHQTHGFLVFDAIPFTMNENKVDSTTTTMFSIIYC